MRLIFLLESVVWWLKDKGRSNLSTPRINSRDLGLRFRWFPFSEITETTIPVFSPWTMTRERNSDRLKGKEELRALGLMRGWKGGNGWIWTFRVVCSVLLLLSLFFSLSLRNCGSPSRSADRFQFLVSCLNILCMDVYMIFGCGLIACSVQEKRERRQGKGKVI